jgi:hypothetical protein
LAGHWLERAEVAFVWLQQGQSGQQHEKPFQPGGGGRRWGPFRLPAAELASTCFKRSAVSPCWRGRAQTYPHAIAAPPGG